MIDNCKKYLNQTKSSANPQKACTCGYEPGEYNIPSMQFQIKGNSMKNMKDLTDYLAKDVIIINKIKLI